LAKYYQGRLKRILESLPKNNLAILRAEALALLHELNGETSIAIRHRKREIKLMERLHHSVHKSVQAGSHDARMATSILANRDRTALKKRQAILKALEREEIRERSQIADLAKYKTS
jgi:hypothetical protein